MSTPSDATPTSPRLIWTGRGLSALATLALLGSATMKLTRNPDMLAQLGAAGFPAEQVPTIGAVELACVVLYAVPRTSVLGAVLLTGYLGGAVCAHVRVGEPFAAALVLGVLTWAGLYLREPRLRALLPLRGA